MVVAEVYPSLLARAVAVRQGDGGIKDRVQVTVLAQALLALDRRGGLDPLFDAPEAADEEGWILGAGQADALERALEAW